MDLVDGQALRSTRLRPRSLERDTPQSIGTACGERVGLMTSRVDEQSEPGACSQASAVPHSPCHRILAAEKIDFNSDSDSDSDLMI